MKRILNIVGARPNFVKMAPIVRALEQRGEQFVQKLVHTGQHYDDRMSAIFFRDLKLPIPDVNLNVGSGSHAQQTAAAMVRLEPLLQEFRPDIVIVVGDVNSTLAGALTAKKLGLKVAHVEAGLRSFDMSMPEEINRLCTDSISDVLFTTDKIADANLLREGIPAERIHFVGNVMIDSLLACRDFACEERFYEKLGLQPKAYATLTLHRPSNIDNAEALEEILGALFENIQDMPIIFPVHPRARQRVKEFGFDRYFTDKLGAKGILMTEPLSYIEFLNLNMFSRLVLTDSGGVQEETTILEVPCVTLRKNTERPITITEGTNHLGGVTRESIKAAIRAALVDTPGRVRNPELWDGKAAERIVDVIASVCRM